VCIYIYKNIDTQLGGGGEVCRAEFKSNTHTYIPTLLRPWLRVPLKDSIKFHRKTSIQFLHLKNKKLKTKKTKQKAGKKKNKNKKNK